jgi:diaminohydroxyphosphoribosylaminopyrimidine deaminase/5-amino-6-(5-phosphoribosylamino)uracil reductase
MDGTNHQIFMQRCLQLAQLGSGSVAPNPMVGAVLVHEGVIIGEGYHEKYGDFHAEVNCIDSVKKELRRLVEQATLYVSLEPCAHFGKTPPCVDLIILMKIPKVVIGCRDPFVQVNGKGIEKLQAAGVEVIQGVLEKECIALNKRFFTFHTKHRPYVIVKWAQTGDGKMARPLLSPPLGKPEGAGPTRLLITNQQTNRLVHKWRSEEMAIAVGTNTALLDDPELSTRLWPGKNPVRIVVDRDLRLPASLKLFDATIPTIVFNTRQNTIEDLKATLQPGVHYYQITKDVNLVQQMLHALYSMNIQSVLVEGGASLLQSFIDEGLWDEARVITNEQLMIGEGLPTPSLPQCQLLHTENILSDTILIYQPIEV